MAIIVVVLVAGAGVIAYTILSSSHDEEGKGQATPMLAFQEYVNGHNDLDLERVLDNSVLAFETQDVINSTKAWFQEAFVNNSATVVVTNLTQIDDTDIPDVMTSYLLDLCSMINMSCDINITDYAVLHTIWSIECSNCSISSQTPYYILMIRTGGSWFVGNFIEESVWIEDNDWADERGGASSPEEAFRNLVMGVNTKDWGVYLKNVTTFFYDPYDLDYIHDIWNADIVGMNVSMTCSDLVRLDEGSIPQLPQEMLESSFDLIMGEIGHPIMDYAVLECHLQVAPETGLFLSSINTSHILVLQISGYWYVNSFIDDATWDMEVGRGDLNEGNYLMYEINDGNSGHLLMRVVAVNQTDYEFSVTYMHDGTSEELEHVFVNRSSGIFWWMPGANSDFVLENLEGTTNYSVDFFKSGETRPCRNYYNITEDGTSANGGYVGVNGIIYSYGQSIGMTVPLNYLLKETNIPWA